jgi:NAD(P)H dehydrogenase (quinone)
VPRKAIPTIPRLRRPKQRKARGYLRSRAERSGAERAALIAEITGRPLAFRVITEEQLRAGLTQAGLPARAVNIVAAIQASFAAGAFDIATGDVERLGGRPPKPLRDVLAAALKFLSA